MTTNNEHLVITQICCSEDTQFANRMMHCEDPVHSVASYAACIGDWCPGKGLGLFTGNLDGVVRITILRNRLSLIGK